MIRVFLLIAALIFASCGGDEAEPKKEEKKDGKTEVKEDKLVGSYVVHVDADL